MNIAIISAEEVIVYGDSYDEAWENHLKFLSVIGEKRWVSSVSPILCDINEGGNYKVQIIIEPVQ